jgi:hypothetical protein
MRAFSLLLASLFLGCLPALAIADGVPAAPAQPPAAPQLPDVLNCQSLSWMKNCTAINTQAQQNPAAPVRVMDQDGLEFDFQPGTPSVVITYALAPTPENAKALWHYYEKQFYRADYEAALMSRVVGAEGGYKGVLSTSRAQSYSENSDDRGTHGSIALNKPGEAGSDEAMAAANPAAYKNVKVYVFYDSGCKWCNKMAPELATLHKAHPDLSISLLQINDDDAGLKKFAALTHLPTHNLDGSPYAEKMRDMVKGTPTIWLQRADSQTTAVVPGYQSIRQLESDIQEVGK